MLKTHVRVVPAYTGFQRVTHHTHHTETDRERETETEKEDRDKERRGDEREREERREKREERREREREREKIHFQCGGAWPFFIDGVLFLVNPHLRAGL